MRLTGSWYLKEDVWMGFGKKTDSIPSVTHKAKNNEPEKKWSRRRCESQCSVEQHLWVGMILWSWCSKRSIKTVFSAYGWVIAEGFLEINKIDRIAPGNRHGERLSPVLRQGLLVYDDPGENVIHRQDIIKCSIWRWMTSHMFLLSM